MSPSGPVSLLDEAWRLEPFVPPFVFSAFFSPEDTLLCVCAAEAARDLLRPRKDGAGVRIMELTSGSGLVGLHLLRQDADATLLGLDIDERAATIAGQNAVSLGLEARARFATSDLWSPSTLELLRAELPQLLVCNPPYVPEPPGMCMQIEAGAGPHGTAHLLRALELARDIQPDALALSWCSLADPARVMAAAAAAGYELTALFVAAIADGEYSGSVHSYLRELGDCYINEQPETLSILGPDGSARFGYLLLAGAFAKRAAVPGQVDATPDRKTNERGPFDGINRNAGAAAFVQRLCRDFAREGVPRLAMDARGGSVPFAVHCTVLDRWAELELRVMLHGPITQPASRRS
jgi:hypothetical protein